MPTPKITTPLEIDKYYHIYNRGNNKGLLFYKDSNYDYFLKRYSELLTEHVYTYAFCLLPNHFHLLIKTKTLDVSKQFRRMFQSYALSINKQENRTGSLFTKYFRRITIDNDDYLKYLVFYIHYNPEKHSICNDFRIITYSSYQSLLNDSNTLLEKEEVYKWFGGRQEFIDFHTFYHEEKKIQKYILD